MSHLMCLAIPRLLAGRSDSIPEQSKSSRKIERIKTMHKKAPYLPGRAALICAAMFLLFTIAGQAQQPLQVLHNHVRPAVAGGQAAVVGLLPSTQRLNLAIMLPLRNQSDLTSLLDRLYDPSSA